MTWFPLLTTLIVLPLAGALVIGLVSGTNEAGRPAVQRLALAFALLTAALSLALPAAFDPGMAGFQFEERADWLPELGISWHLGVDGISVWLVVLAALTVPLAIIASPVILRGNTREFMMALLVLQSLLIGAFSSLDLVLYFMFYEGNLLPLFFLIGTNGGERRTRAAFNFALFNIAGSMFLLIAIFAMGVRHGTFDIPALMTMSTPGHIQTWLWLAMFASFAIKMPLWPLHTWLPEVHVHSPTAVSIVIAAVHMKLGTYGFLRLLLPLLPDATATFAPYVMVLGAITVVQCSLVAVTQTHLKRLLAYATMAHMGFTAIGVFSRSVQSIEGCLLMVFIQGLVSACLFMCIGSIYDQLKTYETSRIAGVIKSMPRLSFVFLALIFGAVALPGTGNFLGEFLILVGAFQNSPLVAVVAGTAIVLGPVYLLGTYHRITFAPTSARVAMGRDLPRGQLAAAGAVIVLMVVLGLHPPVFMSATARSVSHMVASIHMPYDARVMAGNHETASTGELR
jgi:NADH-quinone oxidoreductase subunit M